MGDVHSPQGQSVQFRAQKTFHFVQFRAQKIFHFVQFRSENFG